MVDKAAMQRPGSSPKRDVGASDVTAAVRARPVSEPGRPKLVDACQEGKAAGQLPTSGYVGDAGFACQAASGAPAPGAVYGYARVSSREQNLDRQLDALERFGVADRQVFADRASGKDFERPQWQRLLRCLARGDVLVVTSIDRLGRNYEEILEQWRHVTRTIGADMVVLDMPLLDTRRGRGGVTGVLITDIVLQLLSYVAQVERENIRRRQAEGIEAAKARGVRFGRPRLAQPDDYGEIRANYLAGRTTRAESAEALGVSVSTFDKWLREGSE